MSAESAHAIRDGLRQSGWTARDRWVAAVGIGGAFTERGIQEITSGRVAASAIEHDILACALNEHFVDRGENHPVKYWRDLQTEGA